MNTQEPEKRQTGTGTALDVHSIFYTIQGEGPFTGKPAVFIRLAGCNLACPLCDTDYTTDRQVMNVGEIMDHVNAKRGGAPIGLVVITGGEPFRQNLTPIVSRLLLDGYTVQIETNGTLPPSDIFFERMVSRDTSMEQKCFIVCSPKTGKIHPKLQPLICAYKYVLRHDSIGDDGLPDTVLDHSAGGRVARPHSFGLPVYLQPCDDKDAYLNRRNLDACIESVMGNGYILQLQVHKLIDVE